MELLYLIVFTGILAVAYSYLLSGQILSASPGNAKMQEIAEAIQIGASLLKQAVQNNRNSRFYCINNCWFVFRRFYRLSQSKIVRITISR